MQRLTLQHLSELLDSIYAAAEDPALWTIFLEQLTTVARSESAALIQSNLESRTSDGAQYGVDPREAERYWSHYSKINPWLPKSNASPTDSPIVHSDSVLPLQKLRRTEFYNDWGARNDVVHSIILSLMLQNNHLLYLNLNRGERGGEHSQETEELFALLLPHLHRALNNQIRLRQAEALRAAIDELELAIFVIDKDRTVVDMTQQAQRLVESKQFFTLSARGKLQAFSREDNHALEQCLRAFAGHRSPARRALTLSGTLGQKLLLIVSSDQKPVTGVTPANRFVITVIEPSSPPRRMVESMAALFHLTPAETRLVAGLLDTGSLQDAIARLGITRNTARTQMASIFRKTGTSRNGQVIQLFSFSRAITHMGDDA